MNADDQLESEEEQFQYATHQGTDSDDDVHEPFVYTSGDPLTTTSAPTLQVTIPNNEPAPGTTSSSKQTFAITSIVEFEKVYGAATSGDLDLLQRLFRVSTADGQIDPFSLANEASQRSGLTLLHSAASKGHLKIVQWLVTECGAIVDLEDKEGETAIHKATLNGRLSVIRYLFSIPWGGPDVHAQDADGWTALHNACSKGYLDIVRFLCEKCGAADVASVTDPATRGVDQKSKGGWTPLMNAASKGHLPVVLYLLSKQNADPLVRNKWGETAYDVAASVFEVWICQALSQAEEKKWRQTTASYNPLAVHTTIPLLLHENQRLDTRLKTLALSGGRPKFSSSGLGRKGRRGPFELRLPSCEPGPHDKRDIPAWRSDVELPTCKEPFTLPLPQPNTLWEGTERSHFWLSDWTLDLTHPRVDASDGWQYTKSFDERDENWTAEPPPQLERLLGGSGILSPGASVRSTNTESQRQASNNLWVRRRRWIRVMRRRLDISPLPFMEPDGSLYDLTVDGNLTPHVQTNDNDTYDTEGGAELASMPPSFLSSTHDYVSRAKYLAGEQLPTDPGVPFTSVEVRRSIAKLERAIAELRTGILNDTDASRMTQAEVLRNTYRRELEKQRLAAGAEGFLHPDYDEGTDDDDSEVFQYPAGSPTSTARPASVTSYSTDYFSHRASSYPTIDLTPQLSQAPEFRVPTHDAPQKSMTPQWRSPAPHELHARWERDETVTACSNCKRRFTFLFRKHCRKCGHIFCDKCTSHRATLEPSDVVHDVSIGTSTEVSASTSPLRVCEGCYNQVIARDTGRSSITRSISMEGVVLNANQLVVPSNRSQDNLSQISDLAECPVCGQTLADLGPTVDQEEHVKTCLEGDRNSDAQTGRYLIYKLPGESLLIGSECVICLEEFMKDSLVARLSCLCSFHSSCLSAWLQRGRSCPVHAR